MQKQQSQPETKTTPNKYSLSKKTNWILEQTRNAFEFYSNTKKQQIIKTKQSYFQRIDHHSQSADRLAKSRKRRKNRKKKSSTQPIRKSQRKIDREEVDYHEPQSKGIQPEMQMIRNKESSDDQSSLSAVGKYKLRPVHDVILQMQKTIDSYLQFQLANRRKRTITREQLFSFLSTTRYALSGRRYFQHLLTYSPKLYEWNDSRDRILCKNYSQELISKRNEQTRQRMTRIQISSLLV